MRERRDAGGPRGRKWRFHKLSFGRDTPCPLPSRRVYGQLFDHAVCVTIIIRKLSAEAENQTANEPWERENLFANGLKSMHDFEN